MSPDLYKDLVDLAMSVPATQVKIIGLLRESSVPMSSIKIATRLMLSAREVDQDLEQLLAAELISPHALSSQSAGGRDYVESGDYEFYGLTERGIALSHMVAQLRP